MLPNLYENGIQILRTYPSYWQKWLDDQVNEERYYSGELMFAKIREFYLT
jgi:hypothetical protein